MGCWHRAEDVQPPTQLALGDGGAARLGRAGSSSDHYLSTCVCGVVEFEV